MFFSDPMTRNRENFQRRSLHQLLTRYRRCNPQVNNERPIFPHSSSDPAATPPPRSSTRSQTHAIHYVEVNDLPEPSSPLHNPPESFGANSKMPSLSADPWSSSAVHTKTLSDELRAQAQELDRQGDELHMRAIQLRTMADRIDAVENEAPGLLKENRMLD